MKIMMKKMKLVAIGLFLSLYSAAQSDTLYYESKELLQRKENGYKLLLEDNFGGYIVIDRKKKKISVYEFGVTRIYKYKTFHLGVYQGWFAMRKRKGQFVILEKGLRFNYQLK